MATVNKILSIYNITHQLSNGSFISISGDSITVSIPPKDRVTFDLIRVQFDEKFLDTLTLLVEDGKASATLDGIPLTSNEVGGLKYVVVTAGGTDELVKVGGGGTPDYLNDSLFERDGVSHIRPIQRIDDTGVSADKVWSSSKITSELAGKADYTEIRVVFKEQFTGTGAQTQFMLTSSILNATFSTGSWNVSRVLTTFPSHATKTNKKVLYDSANLFTRNRITVSSIDGLGVVTLSHPPIFGENFYIWYWYEIRSTDIIEDYYREDFISSMEAASDKIASDVPTNTANFNKYLGVGDTTVQLALDTLDDHLHTAADITDFDTEVSNNVDVAANTVHRTSDGTDHTFIDQDVKTTASPTFVALQSIDYIDFDLAASPATSEGRLSWNNTDGTLELGMPGGRVRLQIGQEGLIRVRNVSGSLIANGKIVYVTGSQGQKLTIDLADCCDADKIMLLGMATENIAHNASGYVALWGTVRGEAAQPINTSSYPEGTKLYLSTTGNWTNIHPSNPTHATIIIGIVQRQHASEGEISLQFNYYTLGNNFDGILRHSIINKNTGTLAGTGFTAVNNSNHRSTFGIGCSNNVKFGEATVLYGEGYADNYYAVDGNKSHKWFVDPTDSHNDSSLSYLSLELQADGDLIVYRGQIDSRLTTGTAPFLIASTTLNTNLNADLLDGQHASYFLNVTSVLDDLADVDATSPADTEGIYYNSTTGNWEAKVDPRFTAMIEPTGFSTAQKNASTMSFVNGTRTFSISPTGASYHFYQSGVKYTKTGTENIVISDTEGEHIIYYDAGVLTSVSNPTLGEISIIIRDKVILTWLYWDAANNEEIYFAEERHGFQMDGTTHAWLHFNQGTKLVLGGTLSTIDVDQSGNSNAHAQFGVTNTDITDEDLYFPLSAVASTVGLPVYWKTGSDGNWRRTVNAGFSVLTTGTGRLAWNQFIGGAWQQTEVTNNAFVVYHVFANNDDTYSFISVMGQAVYGNISEARQGANEELLTLITDGLPFAEFAPLASVIFQTSNGYSNAVKARTRSTDLGDDYVSWITSGISPVSISVSSHSALSDLNNDDHFQYLFLNGRSGGQIAYGGNASTEDFKLISNAAHDGKIIFGNVGTTYYDESIDCLIAPCVLNVKTLGYSSAYAIGDSGAAFNLTLSNGQHQTLTLTADCAMTIVDTGNIGDGEWTVTVTQGGVGNFSITSASVAGGTVKSEGGVDPVFSVGAGDVDTMTVKKEGSIYYVRVRALDWQVWV